MIEISEEKYEDNSSNEDEAHVKSETYSPFPKSIDKNSTTSLPKKLNKNNL